MKSIHQNKEGIITRSPGFGWYISRFEPLMVLNASLNFYILLHMKEQTAGLQYRHPAVGIEFFFSTATKYSMFKKPWTADRVVCIRALPSLHQEKCSVTVWALVPGHFEGYSQNCTNSDFVWNTSCYFIWTSYFYYWTLTSVRYVNMTWRRFYLIMMSLTLLSASLSHILCVNEFIQQQNYHLRKKTI